MNSKKIDLKELLKEKKKIALGGHVRPDGDCIGSVMGLYLYLKQEYPHIQTDVYLEKIPETFRLIKGTDEVRSEVNNNETPYDLFICLDCADPMRLGFSSSVFENAKETVCIDHHISNESFADLNYIEKTDKIDKTGSKRGAALYKFNENAYRKAPKFKL